MVAMVLCVSKTTVGASLIAKNINKEFLVLGVITLTAQFQTRFFGLIPTSFFTIFFLERENFKKGRCGNCRLRGSPKTCLR